MHEILPASDLESLQLLRAQLTDTVLQRGILIPHPRDEFELLEEKVLEALELKKERVTKCGHYVRRESAASYLSIIDSDSGLGSSEEDGATDNGRCCTCDNALKLAKLGVGAGNKRWTLKVFAANGLMRANTWSAVWTDMERIDVEIRPWLSEDLQRRLEERRLEEEIEAKIRAEDEGQRIKAIVEEQVRAAVEQREQAERSARRVYAQEAAARNFEQQAEASPVRQTAPVNRPRSRGKEVATSCNINDSLPEVYRAKDVPLSLLLKNYVYLLAQDRRNVAIFFLAVVALFLSLRLDVKVPTGRLTALDNTYYQHVLPEVRVGMLNHSNADDGGQMEVPPSIGVYDLSLDTAASANQTATDPVDTPRPQSLAEEAYENDHATKQGTVAIETKSSDVSMDMPDVTSPQGSDVTFETEVAEMLDD